MGVIGIRGEYFPGRTGKNAPIFMGLELEYSNGQTPLEEDEKDGLRTLTITTREELDEFEQQNIEEAIQWVLTRSLKTKVISVNNLSVIYIDACMAMFRSGRVILEKKQELGNR